MLFPGPFGGVPCVLGASLCLPLAPFLPLFVILGPLFMPLCPFVCCCVAIAVAACHLHLPSASLDIVAPHVASFCEGLPADLSVPLLLDVSVCCLLFLRRALPMSRGLVWLPFCSAVPWPVHAVLLLWYLCIVSVIVASCFAHYCHLGLGGRLPTLFFVPLPFPAYCCGPPCCVVRSLVPCVACSLLFCGTLDPVSPF